MLKALHSSAGVQTTADYLTAYAQRRLAEGVTGPALGEFAEAELGRLAPGMLADIVVLSQDITTAPQTSLAETRSVLTIVGGQIAFDGRAP